MRVTVVILCVCLSVCLSVCYRPSAHIQHVCDKIGLPMYSSLHAKGFKLSVFAKKAFFLELQLLFASHCQMGGHLMLTTALSEFVDHYLVRRPLPEEVQMILLNAHPRGSPVHCIYAASCWSTSWSFERGNRSHDSPLLIRYPTNTAFLTRRAFCTSVLSF